jgi:hypothetical protein
MRPFYIYNSQITLPLAVKQAIELDFPVDMSREI